MPKNIIYILSLTLATLLLWVGFQIFQITTSSPLPTATQKQLAPLNPNLDKVLLEDLNNPGKTLQ